YLARLSPVTDLAVAGDELCGVDLARKSGLFPAASFHYVAQAQRRPSPLVRVEDQGRICLPLAHRQDDYFTVRLANGQATGTLRAYLYDLGPERGFALAGIERPEQAP